MSYWDKVIQKSMLWHNHVAGAQCTVHSYVAHKCVTGAHGCVAGTNGCVAHGLIS